MEQQVWNKCQATLKESRAQLDHEHKQQWCQLYAHQKSERQRFEGYINSSLGKEELRKDQRRGREKHGLTVSKEQVVDAWRRGLEAAHRKSRSQLSRSHRRDAVRLSKQAEEYYTTKTAWIAAYDPREPNVAPVSAELIQIAINQLHGERTQGGGSSKDWNPFEDEEERQRERSLGPEM